MSPPETDPPIPTRMAPPATKPAGAGGKKRPPPMNLKPKVRVDAPASNAVSNGLLSVAPGPTLAPASANTSTNMKRMTYHTTLSNTLANLDLNAEVKYDLRDEDLKDLNELGQGNGGSMKKVEHVPTHTIMVKKVPSLLSSLCTRARAHFFGGADRPHRRQAVSAQAYPPRAANNPNGYRARSTPSSRTCGPWGSHS